MGVYWICFLFMWITGWLIAFHELEYANYTLPKGLKLILFLHTNDKLINNKLINHNNYKFTLHNIIFESLLCLLTVVTQIIFCLNIPMDKVSILRISFLFLIGLFLIYCLVCIYCRVKFWWKGRGQPKTQARYPIDKAIIFELAEVLGLKSGQQLNKEKFEEFSSISEKSLAAGRILEDLVFYTGTNTISKGSKGDNVKELQKFLGLEVSEEFDDNTTQALCELQKKLNIEVDGIYSPIIIDAIKSLFSK